MTRLTMSSATLLVQYRTNLNPRRPQVNEIGSILLGQAERRILMDANSEPPFSSVHAEVSLVRGGLFFRAQQALRLVRPDQWNHPPHCCSAGHRMAAFVVDHADCESPWAAFPAKELSHSFADACCCPGTVTREFIMDSRFRTVFAHIRSAGLLEAPDLAKIDGVVASLVRARAAYLPELMTLADYSQAYEKIERMNSFPADKGALYTLADAVSIPALPMILAQIPFIVVLSDLLKALRRFGSYHSLIL